MSNVIETKITKMSDDDLYRQNVEKLMATGSSQLISNNLPQHASALLSCFLRNAQSEIKIFCNTLRRQVYDTPEVLSSLVAAVGRDIPIQILVRETPEDGSKFYARFMELAQSHKKLSIQIDGAKRSERVKDMAENFSVMDRKAYRWETDCPNVHAVACMNGGDLANILNRAFDRLFAAARYMI